MKRLLAPLLSAALILASPGLPCWQALAAVEDAGAPKGPPAGRPLPKPPVLPPQTLSPHLPAAAEAPKVPASPGQELGHLAEKASAISAETPARSDEQSHQEASFERTNFDSAAPPSEGAPSTDASLSANAPEDSANGARAPPPPKKEKVKLPRSFWGLVWGHWTLIITGINLHVISQPFLVYGMTKSLAMVGSIRTIHWTSYTVTSFLPIGPTVDKTDYRLIYVAVSGIRGLLMGAIPFLFLTHHLTFAMLAAIVVVNPLFQNMMTTADDAAMGSMLGKDEKLNKEATAVQSKISYFSDIFIPLISGWIVSALVAHYGDPGGYAMAYAGYAACLFLAMPIFHYMIGDDRYADPEIKEKPAKRFWNIFLPVTATFKSLSLLLGTTAAWRAGTFWMLPVNLLRVWLGRLLWSSRWVISLFQRALAAKRETAAAGESLSRRERYARFFDRFENTQGASVILRSNVLSLLVVVGAIELFLADPLYSVVLPNYIIQAINPRLDLAHLPLIGSLLSTRAGVYTLMNTAGSIGGFIASHWSGGDKGDARIERLGHRRLFRAAAFGSAAFALLLLPLLFLPSADVRHTINQGYDLMSQPATQAAGRALVLKGLAAIPRWIFFAGLGIMLITEALTHLLHAPIHIAIAPIKREEIPNDKVGKTSAAYNMIDCGLSAIGALSVGFLVDRLPLAWSLAIIVACVMVTAILEWKTGRWLERLNPKGWKKPAPKP